MRIDRLGDLGDTSTVLRAVAVGARRAGLAPPAILSGQWFGARVIIAPSLSVTAVDPADAFAVAPPVTEHPSGAVGGGWLGYLSYPDGGAGGGGHRIPQAAGGWTDCVLRCDDTGLWWFESLSGAAMAGWLAQALTTPAAAQPWELRWAIPDRMSHHAGVEACLAAIRAGEVYQACVCTRFAGHITGSSLEFFADAVTATAPARAAYLAGDWGAVASLSPELFLARHGDNVSSRPIKGTLPEWADPMRLRESVKDVAENIMIVDLVRNDLGRVARTGSVTVPSLLTVERAPGVWHLVSTVTAAVDPQVPAAQLLAATFPPASVTGTPKTRARELLSLWEPHRRGAYCGTVGLASPEAGTELNVAIRTVEFDSAGSAILGVGGGITADSDPDTEWQECLHKAAATIALRCRAAELPLASR